MSQVTSLPAVSLVLFVAVLTACGGADGGLVAHDSAGVRIVVNSDSGSWTDADRPTLREIMRIGRAGADTNYELALPGGVDVGSDGTIYVLDAQAGNIRAFDSSGKFLRRMSRRGNGPGEIGMASAMMVTSGDTILVVDARRQVVSQFAADGTPLGEVPMPFSDGLPMKWSDRGDGLVVVQLRQLNIGAMMAAARSGGAPPAGGPPEPDRLELRSASGKVLDTIMQLPAGGSMEMGGAAGMRVRLFAPEPIWAAAADGRIFFGLNSEYSINEYDSAGTLTRILRRNVERVPVTEEDKITVIKAMSDRLASMGMPPEAMSAMKDVLDFAEFFPAIGQVLAGPDGTLWVQLAMSAAEMTAAAATAENPAAMEVGSRNWDVYNREGRLMGRMHLPERFTPLHWVGDRLVGVEIAGSEEPNVVILQLSTGERRG